MLRLYDLTSGLLETCPRRAPSGTQRMWCHEALPMPLYQARPRLHKAWEAASRTRRISHPACDPSLGGCEVAHSS